MDRRVHDLLEWLQRELLGPRGLNHSKLDFGSKLRSVRGGVGLLVTRAGDSS